MLTTPILLITFNRPQHTRKVLERILEAEPRELYIFQDGAREGNASDIAQCAEVRKVIVELTSSASCSLHLNYSPINLGCGPGPATAISWFFSEVEEGIVMEDDCLAHPDFFPYCEELLHRYKNTSVRFINSTLYDDCWTKSLEQTAPSCSYGYSHYMCTGAWASWREVWQGFDLNLKSLHIRSFYKQVKNLTHNIAEAEWWAYMAKAIKADSSKKSYWDYQMQIHLFRQSAVTIHPKVNLVSNIGFDKEGTHTVYNDGRGNREVAPIMPLLHPAQVSVDCSIDAYCWAKKQSQGILKDSIRLVYHIWKWRNKSFL